MNELITCDIEVAHIRAYKLNKELTNNKPITIIDLVVSSFKTNFVIPTAFKKLRSNICKDKGIVERHNITKYGAAGNHFSPSTIVIIWGEKKINAKVNNDVIRII